jgi:hypothetical protein
MYVRRRKRFAQCESEGEGEQDGCLTSITLITDSYLLSALPLPAQGALLGGIWRLIKVQIRGVVWVVGIVSAHEATCLNTMLVRHLPSDTREP